MSNVADPRTLEIYAREAPNYANHTKDDRASGFLKPFLARLPPGATVLDLGCGSGWAAVTMEEAGFDVHALDACPEFAAIASPKLRRPVRVASFEAVTEQAAYDGIWASGALLHVAKRNLPGLLDQLATALRPNGLLCATFKDGDGETRDKLGRFYAYYHLDELQRLVEATPNLDWLDHIEARGKDFTGNPTLVLGIMARAR